LIISEITESLHDLAFHTTESLAQLTGVSRAAIVRLTRKLGYTGFTELRNLARQEVKTGTHSPLARFTQTDDDPEPTTLLGRKIRQDVRNLSLSQELVGRALPAAADTAAKAPAVFVLGARKSYGLAIYFGRLLKDIRDNVHIVDPGYPDDLARCGKGDVVIALLFRRYSTATVNLIEHAKRRGARIILVTDGASHGFTIRIDHLLVATTDSPTLYHSMVAPLSLLELLGQEIAAQDPSATRASLERAERFTDAQGALLE